MTTSCSLLQGKGARPMAFVLRLPLPLKPSQLPVPARVRIPHSARGCELNLRSRRAAVLRPESYRERRNQSRAFKPDRGGLGDGDARVECATVPYACARGWKHTIIQYVRGQPTVVQTTYRHVCPQEMKCGREEG
jgi:hypothetical protein